MFFLHPAWVLSRTIGNLNLFVGVCMHVWMVICLYVALRLTADLSRM